MSQFVIWFDDFQNVASNASDALEKHFAVKSPLNYVNKVFHSEILLKKRDDFLIFLKNVIS